MENAELLERLLAAIEQSEMRLEVRFREEIRKGQELLRKEFQEGQTALKNDLVEQFTEAMNTHAEAVDRIMLKRMRELETRLNVKIENEVDGKLKALFDGYQSAHEKQWELERRTGQLQDQVDGLEIRVEALESKTA